MDNTVNNYEAIIFNIFKNIIIEQNKKLLEIIANKYNIDHEYLISKYLKPEYYLPVILKDNK
jgi:hypothetical protein